MNKSIFTDDFPEISTNNELQKIKKNIQDMILIILQAVVKKNEKRDLIVYGRFINL